MPFPIFRFFSCQRDYLIRVTLSDDDGGQTVRMTKIGSNNQSPIAVDDAIKMIVGSTVNIAVLKNDTDPDGNSSIDTASLTLVELPVVGVATVQSNGTIRYVAPAGFLGKIAFSYTVADNLQFVSNTALVTMDIVSASYQNPRNRLDVDDDGYISPLDVLVVVNQLNRNRIRNLVPSDFGPPFIDVDGNNWVDPTDVLDLINYINRRSQQANGEEEGEGEWAKSGSIPLAYSNPGVWHEVDKAWSVSDYFDILNIRKRAKITDAAFMEFGDDTY